MGPGPPRWWLTVGEARAVPPTALVIRHGETEWSMAGRHTGRTDIPLTDRGRAQVAELATVLSGERFAEVMCSPLRRAKETCEGAGLAGRARIHEALAEWDYGAYEGLTTAEIRATRPGWSLWRDGCPGGESPQDVSARADEVVRHILSAGGEVAIFSHGHFLRALVVRWMGLDISVGARFALYPRAGGLLGWEHDDPAVLAWNVAVTDG